jgi:hypothetical protein
MHPLRGTGIRATKGTTKANKGVLPSRRLNCRKRLLIISVAENQTQKSPPYEHPTEQVFRDLP